MLDEFIRYIEAERRYSPLTIRNYRHDVEQFLAGSGIPDTPSGLQAVTTDDIRAWILRRTEEDGIGAASMNREVSSLRSFFRWLLVQGVVTHNVVQSVSSLKTARRLPAFVPESRMSRIVNECGFDSEEFDRERDSLIILLNCAACRTLGAHSP